MPRHTSGGRQASHHVSLDRYQKEVSKLQAVINDLVQENYELRDRLYEEMKGMQCQPNYRIAS
jgi:hypothetical protein